MKTANSWLFSIARQACLLFGAIFALWPCSAKAQCLQWQINDHWQLKQSNGFLVTLDTHQNGSDITGTASSGKQIGKITGVLKGEYFNVHISWGNGSVGVYNGKIGSSGQIDDGRTYDKGKSVIGVPWVSGSVAHCAQMVQPTPPPDTLRPPREHRVNVHP